MRKYKLVLLLKSGLSKEKKDGFLSDLKKWIGKVENEKTEDLGEKKLAYIIKKEKSANYLVLNFESDKPLSSDIEKKLIIDDNVIRHLVIKI